MTRTGSNVSVDGMSRPTRPEGEGDIGYHLKSRFISLFDKCQFSKLFGTCPPFVVDGFFDHFFFFSLLHAFFYH